MSVIRRDSLRRHLDKNFKPAFDEYDADGIPLAELKSLLADSELPERQISVLVKAADKDGNQRIAYDEFVRQIMSEDEGVWKRLRIRARVLNRAVLAIDPAAGRRHQQDVMVKSGIDSPDTYNWGEADVDNYVEAYDCRPPPIFIPVITLVEIGVFIYYGVLHALDSDPYNDVTAASGVPIYSPLIYDPRKRHEAWRFLTYMFIHNGYVHLAFNCLLQLVLGMLLELVHKFWRCGLVYLLGVIAGSLAHSITDPYVLLAGASGGCYALIGAHLASIIMNWKAMQDKWLDNPINFLSSGVVRLFLILLLAGSDTGLAIYARYKNPLGTRVGFSAHLGGFVAGILLGIPILRNLQVEKWEKVCFWICIVIFACFITAAILFNGFCIRIKYCPASVF
ncbi:Rhomboid- protein 2 [Clonorchis sinensis]|uniref:Rhomboid- protein 2 n=1 Tax=Clonorchis sinensis TaxID=79923 RepID=A0A8T1MCQ9_CLOSI|nr:Rhomboid- protein 2 [Clonorchis sinensis]